MKLYTPLAALLLIGSSACYAQGQIQITGSITATACEFSNPGTLSVPMGTMALADFDSTTTAGSERQFAVNLKNCPATLNTIQIEFTGEEDVNDPTKLQLNNTSAASGIGIGFYEKNGSTVIPMKTLSQALPLTPGTNSLVYYAKVQPTGPVANIVAGDFSASTSFALIYN